MDKLKEYKDMFKEIRPMDWDLIPDIDLYMDQVVSFMERQHIGLSLDESLTSSMVNNYVKQGVLPRATGKRYNRDHIAYLTAICLLKQVTTVSETKSLLDTQLEDISIKKFYEKYSHILDKELNNVDTKIGENNNKKELSEIALELAISSYASKLACECILKYIAEKDEE